MGEQNGFPDNRKRSLMEDLCKLTKSTKSSMKMYMLLRICVCANFLFNTFPLCIVVPSFLETKRYHILI